MNKETAVKALLDAMNGFHGRFKKIYGFVALRIDEDTYLTSGGNKLISGIIEDDLEICDINSGDLGELFNKRPDINAFIFGCSEDTVTAASELDSLPVALEDLAQLAGPSVNIAANATPRALMNALRTSNVCLVKGTGAVAVSSDIRDVVASLHIVQKGCEAYVHGKMLGGMKPLNDNIATWLRATYTNEYLDVNAEDEHVDYIGFDEELFQLRSTVIEAGKQLVEDDLVFGRSGNLSLRVNENEMLISPSSMDYYDIGIEDVVQLNIDSLDYGSQRVPSSDAEMHANMYKELAGCNAIIHTHSNGCGVFAACEAGFALTDPQLQQLIGDVRVVPYTPESPDVFMNNLLATLQETHAVILPHHGAIFYGPSLEIVHEIAKSVEMMARNILQYDARNEESEQSEEQ